MLMICQQAAPSPRPGRWTISSQGAVSGWIDFVSPGIFCRAKIFREA